MKILFPFWFFAFFLLSTQEAISQTIIGRFIALDKSTALMSTHEPKQRFIVETPEEALSTGMKLIKVVYFAPTNGFRGGAKLLTEDTINYKNLWRLKLHQPIEDRERDSCKQIDNFLRVKNGKAYIDKMKEPVVLFRSTQFEADIIFEQLPDMPCMILDSVEDK